MLGLAPSDNPRKKCDCQLYNFMRLGDLLAMVLGVVDWTTQNVAVTSQADVGCIVVPPAVVVPKRPEISYRSNYHAACS